MIQMINKERAPTTRHVSRTLRVDLDWLIERLSNDSSVLLMHVRTTDQLYLRFIHRESIARVVPNIGNLNHSATSVWPTALLSKQCLCCHPHRPGTTIASGTSRQFDGTMTPYVFHMFHGATTNEIQRHIDGWISSGQDSDGNVYSLLNPVLIELFLWE